MPSTASTMANMSMLGVIWLHHELLNVSYLSAWHSAEECMCMQAVRTLLWAAVYLLEFAWIYICMQMSGELIPAGVLEQSKSNVRQHMPVMVKRARCSNGVHEFTLQRFCGT